MTRSRDSIGACAPLLITLEKGLDARLAALRLAVFALEAQLDGAPGVDAAACRARLSALAAEVDRLAEAIGGVRSGPPGDAAGFAASWNKKGAR